MNPSDFMQYVRRGWPVLPIEPGTKYTRWDLLEHPVADYFASPARADEIVRWAAAGAVVAVALKGAGLAVLDIDERDLGRAWIEENGGWPGTPRVRTPHGWHVYFKAADAMYAGVVEVDGEKIADFLVGHQCYVLAPPTPGYEWEIGLDAPLADAPTWALCAVVRKRPDSWLCCDPDGDEDDEWQYDIEEAEARFGSPGIRGAN